MGHARLEWPVYAPDERAAVQAVLGSGKVNYWTGEQVKAFEKEFAVWTNCRHAVAVANGTVALDLALHGLGIGAINGGSRSDEVVVTPRTFIASASCIVNAGAKPVFADVDGESGNITAESIGSVLSANTRALIVVHLAGWPCDMQPIMALASARNLRVIEDCAQAHGAVYNGRSVGSIGDVGAWSFCQDKIMSTGGEGGMVTTQNQIVWERMWRYKDHGKCLSETRKQSKSVRYRWLHGQFGTNWRMMEMQAAIGRLQLKKMQQWTAIRQRNAFAIREALEPFAGPMGCVRAPIPNLETSVHAYYKFYCYIRSENLQDGWSRDRIIEDLRAQGVKASQGVCPEVYLEAAFSKAGLQPEEPLPVARLLGESSIMFLVDPTIQMDEVTHTCRAVQSTFGRACRENGQWAA